MVREREKNATDGVLEREEVRRLAEERAAAEAAADHAKNDERLRLAQGRLASLEENTDLSELQKTAQRDLQHLANELEATRSRSAADKTKVEKQAAATRNQMKLGTALRDHIDLDDVSGSLRSFRAADLSSALTALLKDAALSKFIVAALAKRPADGFDPDDADLQRCLEHMRHGKWLDAHDVLTAHRGDDQPKPSPTVRAARLLGALCEAQMTKNIDTYITPQEIPHTDLLSRTLGDLVLAFQAQRDRDPIPAYGRALACLVAVEQSMMTSTTDVLAPLATLSIGVLRWAGDAMPSSQKLQQKTDASEEFRRRAASSDALMDVVSLTGLTPVKETLLNIKDTVDLAKQRGDDPAKKQYNAIFTGNPSTGALFLIVVPWN